MFRESLNLCPIPIALYCNKNMFIWRGRKRAICTYVLNLKIRGKIDIDLECHNIKINSESIKCSVLWKTLSLSLFLSLSQTQMETKVLYIQTFKYWCTTNIKLFAFVTPCVCNFTTKCQNNFMFSSLSHQCKQMIS